MRKPARGAITIVGYDPRWPVLFDKERTRLLDAIGRWVVAVEHIGSTAVLGLAAKPIIDILVGLRDQADGERCIKPLEALGYEYRGESGIPGRLFFRKLTDSPAPGQLRDGVARTHHLHMFATSNPEFERHLAFRDYLRLHPAIAAEYAALKRKLAARFDKDFDSYTEAKTDFIRSVEAKARKRGRRAGV